MKRWHGVAVVGALLFLIGVVGLRWWGNLEHPFAVSFEYPQATILTGPERTAALGLTPQDEAHLVGNHFVVRVYVESMQMPINAASATIRYPTEYLRVTRVSLEHSIFELWPIEPMFLNDEPVGLVRFAGGLPTPGFIGDLGTLVDIEFEVIKEGISIIEFTDGMVLANNGFGDDILKEMRPTVITVKRSGTRKADINGDGVVDLTDLGILISNLHKDPNDAPGDVNSDGRIDLLDISIVFAEWK